MSRSSFFHGAWIGKLTLIAPIGARGRTWLCACDCGARVSLCEAWLLKSRSCGCAKFRQGNLSQSLAGSSWQAMISRCHRPGTSGYEAYGGSGITVCDRWRNSLPAFVEDMGPRPAGTTLDRLDPRGHYEPGNCRWATHSEQNRNKRNTVLLEFNGKGMCPSAWADELGLPRHVVHRRLSAGWTVEATLATPVDTSRSNGGTTATLEFKGQTMTILEAARAAGITEAAMRGRLKSGWSVERAMTEPLRPWPTKRVGQLEDRALEKARKVAS